MPGPNAPSQQPRHFMDTLPISSLPQSKVVHTSKMRPFLTTPEDDGTSDHLLTIEVSTPWTEILLEERRKTPTFSPPIFKPKPSLPSAYRSRFGRSHKGTWLAILVTIAGLLYLTQGAWKSDIQRPGISIVVPPSFEGLQFINANHPLLRVCINPVCLWFTH